MKKSELVYREMLYQAIEKKSTRLTQLQLSKELSISLSTVNLALSKLRKMNAIKVNQRSFDIIDARKILYHWACIRDVEKDIVLKTRAEEPIRKIESQMPSDAIFTAFSAYKLRFGEAPADYSEVYVYGDENEIRKRFGKNEKEPNLFVLRNEDAGRYGKIATIAQTYVDLWNLKEWYAKEYLKALEGKINGILE